MPQTPQPASTMLTPSTTGASRTATVLSAAAKNSPLLMKPLLSACSPSSATPKAKSGAAMASAMALHFFGYEFARGSNMALFTSTTLGFGASSGSYYPLAMTCVSPVSMVLLLAYGRQLDAKGPRKALRNTTFLCITMLALSGMAVTAMQHNEVWANIKFLSWTMSQLVVWASFVFQSSYAHLLYAQQWSFLGSIFTPSEAGKYYSYIAGLSSVTSMIAGASVSKLVDKLGLPGLLGMAALSLTCTLLLADWAYSLSEKHGFDPSKELEKLSKQKKSQRKANEEKLQSSSTDFASSQQTNNSLFHQIRHSISLFQRVPILGALFFEALSFQCLSTILNTCLVTQLKDAVPDDAQRAAWTGNFYACVNGLSTMFQFFLMPILNQSMEPKLLWRWMPILPLLCGVARFLPTSFTPNSFVTTSSSSALYTVAISFLAAKTMDYSLRGVLAEMAYVPLSFESRFKGKEIIAVFANRFGKSGMAFILSGLHFAGGGGAGLSGLTLFVTLGWLTSAVSLSKLIPSKSEAERLVA
eukprot:CAMPEP_0172579962 /NCGR_PEP_ID=MMETSP1067-20121228/139515_1 /TAXON_ID=265564 ORGANISM="Thalassiosira punctigera, Strain Tpunct2005C2" /NCGR_SAMPLE_ID=MMETSP1067 /ASSEMBLY_ACC=CAM_ASM_000444 /LENGTH=527 /DNA_ID=CAMNT_0013372693 /DNA_START=127 /DNA_END=1707 /DNA_ORIENTATION=-